MKATMKNKIDYLFTTNIYIHCTLKADTDYQ